MIQPRSTLWREHFPTDCWSAVMSQLQAVVEVEAAYCDLTGSPVCFSASRGAAGAKLMAWRLLSAGHEPTWSIGGRVGYENLSSSQR